MRYKLLLLTLTFTLLFMLIVRAPFHQSATAIAATEEADTNSGKIVFVSDRDQPEGIYSMNPDGTDVKRLSDPDSLDVFPALSPDGKYIAYLTAVGDTLRVFLMNSDGSNAHQLTRKPTDAHGVPAWSPDSKQIAFSVYEDGLWVVDVDGSNERRLYADDTIIPLFPPSWTPDGEGITYNQFGAVLVTYNLKTKKVTPVFPGKKQTGMNFHWSPDGKHALFTDDEQLMVADADGSNLHAVTEKGEYESVFSCGWSPDSKQIIYYAADGIQVEAIYIMDADGDNKQSLSPGKKGLKDYMASWGISTEPTEEP